MNHGGIERSYLDPKRREALLSEVIKIIKCIILSTQCKITCEELATDYKDLEGESIPFLRLGFFGLYDFLRSIRNVVQYDAETDVIELVNENAQLKSIHIRKMVANCRKTYPGRQRFISHGPRAVYTPRNSAPDAIPQPFCSLQDLDNRDLFIHHDIQLYALRLVNKNKGLDTQTFEVELNKYIEQPVNFLYGTVDKLLARLSHLFVVRNHKIYPNLSCYADDVKQFGSPGNNKYVPLVPIQTKYNLSDLLEANPHGILWYELRTMYQAAYRIELDYSLYGFTGIMQMIGSMPQLFLRKLVRGEYHFFDGRKPYPPAPQVPPKAIINIQKLLALFRYVVDLKYFLPLYEIVFQETFNYLLMKFESLEEALLSLKSEGIVMVRVGTERLALLESIKNDTIPANHPLLGVNGPNGLTYPEGVMIPQNKIPRLVFPKNLQIKQSISIICLDSFGPHYFFGRFVTGTFYELQGEIALFYAEEKTDLKIPPNAYTLGLVCVACFGGGHQRVMIMAFLKHTQEFLALRVDYGGLMIVEMGTLYYMPVKFAEMPTQAFLCNLAGIVPANSAEVFSPECFDYFKRITKGKLVTAQIQSLDHRKLEMSISITTVLNGKTTDITQELISKGFAEPSIRKKAIRNPPSYAFWLLYERMYHL